MNLREHCIRILNGFMIPKAQDAVAFLGEPYCSSIVVHGTISVLTAVQFHDESRLGAKKIHDEVTERRLSMETESIELPTFQ